MAFDSVARELYILITNYQHPLHDAKRSIADGAVEYFVHVYNVDTKKRVRKIEFNFDYSEVESITLCS